MRDFRTLTEKLKEPDAGPAAYAAHRLRRSILLNLRRVLNSRRGSAPSAIEYGIIDLSAILHNYPESVGEMAESIRRCVRRYEPRLTHVRVVYDKHEEDELTLRFHISAQVSVPGMKSRLGFDTVVTSSGRVNVKR